MKQTIDDTSPSQVSLSDIYQWMIPFNRDASSHITSNEILKPNRAHGRAGAIRQMLFLAYCQRPAQSGRRLLKDEINNSRHLTLTSLTKRHLPVDDPIQQRRFIAYNI
ncbi:hypothetical protein BHE17_07660 [Planococcus maritimus]|nr:hypothetical protein BHE17_07660 [Planococcus maritimus]